MKTEIHNCRHTVAAASNHLCGKLRNAITTLKERLIENYESTAPNSPEAIRSALDKAEEQAWGTQFPHLFFPDFAEIGLEAIVSDGELVRAA